jgi:hypothetical protein
MVRDSQALQQRRQDLDIPFLVFRWIFRPLVRIVPFSWAGVPGVVICEVDGYAAELGGARGEFVDGRDFFGAGFLVGGPAEEVAVGGVEVDDAVGEGEGGKGVGDVGAVEGKEGWAEGEVLGYDTWNDGGLDDEGECGGGIGF